MLTRIPTDCVPDGVKIEAVVCTHEMRGPISWWPFGKAREGRKIILTTCGQMGQYNPEGIIDWYHPMFNIDEIEEIEYTDSEIVHYWRYHIATLLAAIIGIFWWLIIVVSAYDVITNFDSYYYAEPIQSASETAKETATSGIDGVGWLQSLFMIGVIAWPFICKDNLWRMANRQQLRVKHRDGVEYFFGGKFPYQKRIDFCRIPWIVFIMFAITTTLLNPQFLVEFIVFEVIAIGCIIAWIKIDDLVNSRDDGELAETISTISLGSFYRRIATIMGEENQEGTYLKLEPLDVRMGDRIKELKERLETHERILNDLTKKEWPLVYAAPAAYMGMAQIRRCVEKLLVPKVRDLGINIKPNDRGINTLQNILLKNEALDEDILRDLQIITAITNPAAHDFDNDEDNYITALTSFVKIVEWYVDE